MTELVLRRVKLCQSFCQFSVFLHQAANSLTCSSSLSLLATLQYFLLQFARSFLIFAVATVFQACDARQELVDTLGVFSRRGHERCSQQVRLSRGVDLSEADQGGSRQGTAPLIVDLGPPYSTWRKHSIRTAISIEVHSLIILNPLPVICFGWD